MKFNSLSLYLFFVFLMISQIQGSIKYVDDTNLVQNGTCLIIFKTVTAHSFQYNFTYFKNIETGKNYIFSVKDLYEKAAQGFNIGSEEINIYINNVILIKV